VSPLCPQTARPCAKQNIFLTFSLSPRADDMFNICNYGRATSIPLLRLYRRMAPPYFLNDKIARFSPIRSYRLSILQPNQQQIISRIPKSILYGCKKLYILLERYGDNIVGSIAEDSYQMSQKPRMWWFRVRIELHDVCEGPICIQIATQATRKSVAKKNAFSEALKTLSTSLVASVIVVRNAF
jgi:hypothetical protein